MEPSRRRIRCRLFVLLQQDEEAHPISCSLLLEAVRDLELDAEVLAVMDSSQTESPGFPHPPALNIFSSPRTREAAADDMMSAQWSHFFVFQVAFSENGDGVVCFNFLHFCDYAV
mmetsp:Transcript_27360/g.68994  ORF Transcript_27360/g.68994 Transcript_27360/m.68994 type:complete len:115 (+) Transcript_27360:2422-2766(+)